MLSPRTLQLSPRSLQFNLLIGLMLNSPLGLVKLLLVRSHPLGGRGEGTYSLYKTREISLEGRGDTL